MAMFVPDRTQKILVVRDVVYEYANFMLPRTSTWKDRLRGEQTAMMLSCSAAGNWVIS